MFFLIGFSPNMLSAFTMHCRGYKGNKDFGVEVSKMFLHRYFVYQKSVAVTCFPRSPHVHRYIYCVNTFILFCLWCCVYSYIFCVGLFILQNQENWNHGSWAPSRLSFGYVRSVHNASVNKTAVLCSTQRWDFKSGFFYGEVNSCI